MRLRHLTEADLSSAAGWFDDPEVRRWLGGRDWITRALRLVRWRPGTEFRGVPVLRSYAWIGVVDDQPVGYIGGDVYDRWWDDQTPAGA